MIESVDIGWRELHQRLRGFISRRVAPADVDDVLQEALLRTQRGLDRLADEERFGPWVYRVTRSAIGDHLRARARAVPSVAVPVDEALVETSDGGEQDLVAALTGCLSRFVAELPSPYREAVTLTHLEGLSQKQAADRIGISLSGMKSRVQRGREHLRATFERCCALTQDVRGQVIACEPRRPCGDTDCAHGDEVR